MKITSLLYLSLLASVAACSGGGSSSPSSAANTGPTDPPAATNVAVFNSGTSTNADVVGVSYDSTCTTNCPTTTPISVAASSTVTIGTDATGNNTLTLNINDGGGSISHTFDTANAIPVPNETGFSEVTDNTSDPNNVYSVSYGGSISPTTNNSLSYVTFGLWAQTPNTNGNPGGYGVFAAGNVTPTSAMPVTASATYNGTTIGEISQGGNFYNTTGTMTATATYGGAAPSVSGSMAQSVVNGPNGSGAWTSFTFNEAAIAGNHFGGTINAAASTNGVNSSVLTTEAMSGPIQGSFYGPQANEIGGVYSLTGAAGTASVGAFGARK